ncbi:MAG: tetratricopeptide repeat protein [Candidatus Omnitrophica bacterium]|nr:tetratricopeptide repeat protein [Candidatus Omnitrophota bacterium]
MKRTKLFCYALMMLLVPAVSFGQESGPGQSVVNQADDYAKLKAELDSVTKDRDNLRKQMEILLKQKKEIMAAKQQLATMENERAQWELERQSLKNRVTQLQNDNSIVSGKMDSIQMENSRIQEDRDALRATLAESKAGYIVISDLKKTIQDQKGAIARLEQNTEQAKNKLEKAVDDLAKAQATVEVLRGQVKEANVKYKKALVQNKTLEKKLANLPREYAEIARENKILLKRTALMHYNLGVFYTKNKEYTRAVAEFEKAIELNPEDAQAYFNLGYIYAEFYVDRPKAIENFQKYLLLAKKEDKDIDWAKKYILTWQTWEGKTVSK